MNARTYGRHCSGYETPGHPRRFSTRYPYTTGLLWTLLAIGAFLYISTHWWPADPWGMTVAWIAGAGAFIRLTCLLLADLDE